VEIIDRRTDGDGDLYEVTARVRRPDGSTVDDVGLVSVSGARGEALANARMKCVTKAKRRAVLSACGLGMLDETEVDSVPDAVRVPVDRAQPAAPALPPSPDARQDRGLDRYRVEMAQAATRAEVEDLQGRFLTAIHGSAKISADRKKSLAIAAQEIAAHRVSALEGARIETARPDFPWDDQ
jgi:hypothetical protein